VDEIAQERSDIKVGKVNVDEQGELAGAFGVNSIRRSWSSRTGRSRTSPGGARPKADILAML
jgi:thioredoxin 1